MVWKIYIIIITIKYQLGDTVHLSKYSDGWDRTDIFIGSLVFTDYSLTLRSFVSFIELSFISTTANKIHVAHAI